MMNCEQALLLISGHLDNGNSPQEEADLQAHLEACPQCRQVLEDFRMADAGLLDGTVEAPAGLCDRVMEQVRRKASPKRKQAKWVTMGALAAAAALVMGIGYYTLPGGSAAQDGAVFTAADNLARSAAEVLVVAEEEVMTEADMEMPAESESAPLAPITDPADLARRLEAPVVVLEEAVAELDGLGWEQLDDGAVLYLLDTAEAAGELGRTYGAMVYDPGTAAEVSFALVP